MRRILLVTGLLVALSSCGNSELQFERLDGNTSTALPMKLESFQGLRDGDSVKAEAQFKGGVDSATINMTLHLGPPAQFTSGTYRAMVGGKASEGSVDCSSLTYLGGQGNLPSIGAVFVLKDPQGLAIYRVQMPPTAVVRRLIR